MMVKEKKKPKKETWPKFPPWEGVDYKDQIVKYFKTIKRSSYVCPKLETTEEQGVRASPWLAALRGVEGRVGALGWD
jgi:hypothetical protein